MPEEKAKVDLLTSKENHFNFYLGGKLIDEFSKSELSYIIQQLDTKIM